VTDTTDESKSTEESKVDETEETKKEEKTPEEVEAEKAAADKAEADKAEADKAAAAKAAADAEDALPEWASKELKAVRGEAAGYRVKLRDAIEKLEGTKTVEEFEAAVGELREENDKLQRQQMIDAIARDAELPKELAEVLQGATEEELKAHAEKLKKFAPAKKKKQIVPEGGLDPDEGNDSFDAEAIIRAERAKRR
jgi:hypothetical protein